MKCGEPKSRKPRDIGSPLKACAQVPRLDFHEEFGGNREGHGFQPGRIARPKFRLQPLRDGAARCNSPRKSGLSIPSKRNRHRASRRRNARLIGFRIKDRLKRLKEILR